jgi:peroxiredoxin
MRRFLGSAAGDTARRVLVLALTGALALVATLGVQSRGMRRSIVALERRAFLPYAGMVVPAVEVTTLVGEPLTIGDPPLEGRQVLLFFTTTCGYCRQTLPAWQQLADTLGARGPAVVGVSLDSLRPTLDYVREHWLTFPVVELADARMRALYRAKGVPITLVVAEGGRVVHARMGALTTQGAVDSVLAAVRARVNVPLDEEVFSIKQ